MISTQGGISKIHRNAQSLMRPGVYGRTESEGRTHIALCSIDETMTQMEGLCPHAIFEVQRSPLRLIAKPLWRDTRKCRKIRLAKGLCYGGSGQDRIINVRK